MFRLLLLIALCGCSHALYGGKEIQIEEAPYQVSIWERKHHKCGGAIVNHNWILTAGNCVDAFVENFSVHAGSKTTSGGSVHQVAEVKHLTISGTEYSKFSLIRLETPITFSSTRQPVYLADSNDKVSPNHDLEVTGYGYTDGFIDSQVLRKIQTKSMLLEDCVKRYGSRLSSIFVGLLCPDNYVSKTSSCSGDAGNPVLKDGVLVAVTTSRNACGNDDQPDVFVMVAKAREWIKTVTGV